MEREKSPNGKYLYLIAAIMAIDSYIPWYRQLASLSAKVQAYEDVIRKLSGRFGVSDEQLVNIALAAVSDLTYMEVIGSSLRSIRSRLQT